MVVEWMTKWVSECRSALGADSNDLHRHGMNLASAKDALWCLPFCGRGLMSSIWATLMRIVKTRTERKGLRGESRMKKQTAISHPSSHIHPCPPPHHLVEEGESMKTFAKESKHFWSVISSFTIPNNICFNQQVLKTAHLQQNEVMRII